MNNALQKDKQNGAIKTALTEHEVKVMLVDDQAIIGEAVRRMLAPEKDIRFRYVNDPQQALQAAEEFSPTIILQDLVMPEMDGLALVKLFRENPQTSEIPVIVLSTKEEPKVKAESFALGASDYIVKLPDRIELIARIRHHSQGYINLLQRNEAHRALVKSQNILSAELAEAAAYVRSLLPAPIKGPPIETDWRFIPSTQLGGDAFSYHWIDGDHFCFFLLDVCGHGVGAALLSISAMNVICSEGLPRTDFRDPGATLSALNETFLMEKHNNMYFTIWYGVYNRKDMTLSYSSAGHPPALLINPRPGGAPEVARLSTPGMVLGGMPGTKYATQTRKMETPGTLYVVSDGTFEIAAPNGSLWPFAEYTRFLAAATIAGGSPLAELEKKARALHGPGALDDDFSILRVDFTRP
ncbi:MAG: SpoIIE family protein phosphatase [Kiritimatiellae bacterium]|nr:SpoIIE family protein phosphatase [Kiritimatiellia bacterium]